MKKALLGLALLMTSTIATAGGFQLQEYSITNLGRVFGGAGVVGDDYSAIALNPAGMDLKDSGLQAGATFVRLRTMFDGKYEGTPAFGENRANKLLPHFFAQKRMNDRWTLGMGVYAPFGLGTYYTNKNWLGAGHAINSSIVTADVAVASSFKLTDKWTIGASVFAEYLKARLTSTGSDMNAQDNTAPGYSVGIMYRPQLDTRFGVSYRSRTIHKISGPHYFGTPLGTLYGDCSTKLILPEHVLLSAYQKLGKWGLGAMARWTRWSRFSKLNIYSDAIKTATSGTSTYAPEVDEDWKNVWMVGGGVDYDVNQNWTLRAGLAYDEGAVKRSISRTARAPDTDRWITGLGASYKKGNWQWDLAYSHVFWKTGSADNQVKETTGFTTLTGKYRSTVDIVGIGMQYHF